jgi:aspartokinase/homoserine dehydrogenase 1
MSPWAALAQAAQLAGGVPARGQDVQVQAPAGEAASAVPGTAAVDVVLFGTGVVGSALLTLLATPSAAPVRLLGAANSRRQHLAPAAPDGGQWPRLPAGAGEPRDDVALLAALDAGHAPVKAIVDATASEAVAARHPQWLARGYRVVTANKALAGGPLTGWLGLQQVLGDAANYGDAALVGAGLPVLSTLRRLRRCGDQLQAVEGVFSGSLSWLFNRYDGSVPFSTLLHEARELGYAEPDPRADLSGVDVCRKLLIVARTAGFALEAAAVQAESLVPATLRGLPVGEFLHAPAELDRRMAARYAEAASSGRVLRYLARLDEQGRASVGLAAVPASHFAASLSGADNVFAFTTTRYRAQPLVIRGPGAGAEVTAQALLGDLLDLA